MDFIWLDWVLLIIVLVSALISLRRGFVKESLSLLIWILAFILALVFYEPVSVYLQVHIESPSIRKVAAVLTVFVATLLAGALILFIIGRLVAVTGLTGLDRLLGMVFGALRGVIIVVVLLMLAQYLLPVQQEDWWKKAVLVPHFVQLESWVVALANEIRQLISPLLGMASGGQ